MKEELQSKLVEILSSIQTVAGKAGDFAMEQLPDVAQSYVAYGRAYTTAISAVAVASVILSVCIVMWALAKEKRATKKYEADKAAEASDNYKSVYRHHYFEFTDIFPMPFIPAVVGLVLFFANLSQLLLVWFAPKVWLLKEIAGMVR